MVNRHKDTKNIWIRHKKTPLGARCLDVRLYVRLYLCYLFGEGIEGEEAVSLGGVWKVVDASLGIDLGLDLRSVEVLGGGLDKQ